MNDELTDISNAYFNIRNKYLKYIIYYGQIKNIYGFIEVMEEMLKRSGSMHSSEVADYISLIGNADNKTTMPHNDEFSDIRKKTYTDTKLMMDFIYESDRNQIFLNGYIEYVASHFHYYKRNIINAHPFLKTQCLVDMFMNPLIIENNGCLGARHYYSSNALDDEGTRDVIYTIDFWMGLFIVDDAVEITPDKLLKLEFSGAVSSEAREAITTYIDYAINDDVYAYVSTDHYVLTHLLSDTFHTFSLTLFLPKEYFRLKR